jgi:hypothetical protein
MSEVMSLEAARAPYDPNLFHRIAQRAQNNYSAHVATNKPMFRVELPKGALFTTYLDNLPIEYRQQMNCSCCRSFLNRMGNLVTISTDEASFGKLESVFWRERDIPEEWSVDPVFNDTMQAMRNLVESATIGYHFLSSLEILGIPEKGGFEHFAVKNEQVFENKLFEAHEVVATEYQSFGALSKFIGVTVKQELIDQILVYFKHDKRLKDMDKWIGHLEWLAQFKTKLTALPQKQRRAYTWLQVATQSPGRVDLKNSPLGKFMKNIINGVEYEAATRMFLSMTGEKYMKATVAPKEGNIKRAETVVEKLGLASALNRRPLMHSEVRGKIWTTPVAEVKEAEHKPVFGHLKPREEKKPPAPALPEITYGSITLKRFLEEVLPEAVEIYFDYSHNYFGQHYPIVGFNTSVDADAKPILTWDKEDNRNPVSGYLYQGGSTASHWALPRDGKVRVTAITVGVPDWSKEVSLADMADTSSVIFILESGRDTRVTDTPMFAESFLPELHGVRSVLDAHFRSQPMAALPEGENPVVGITATTKGEALVTLKVVKKDAVVRYVIDRSH